jgi:hypothetical protein
LRELVYLNLQGLLGAGWDEPAEMAAGWQKDAEFTHMASVASDNRLTTPNWSNKSSPDAHRPPYVSHRTWRSTCTRNPSAVPGCSPGEQREGRKQAAEPIDWKLTRQDGEVVAGEQLALQDGEVDLDRVQHGLPGGRRGCHQLGELAPR